MIVVVLGILSLDPIFIVMRVPAAKKRDLNIVVIFALVMNKYNFKTKHSSVAIIISAIIVSSLASGLLTPLQQNAFAQTAAEIEEKNLKEARRALQAGNTTSAIENILTILEWEFKEVHPREAASFPGGNVTAGE